MDDLIKYVMERIGVVFPNGPNNPPLFEGIPIIITNYLTEEIKKEEQNV